MVKTEGRFLSQGVPLIWFSILFLWISYAMIFSLTQAVTLIEILSSAILFPGILAAVTYFLSTRSLDQEKLEKRRFGGYWTVSLTQNRFGNWLVKRRWFQFLIEFPNVLFFFLVIVTGIYGYGGYIQAVDAGPINASTFLTWNLWWPGIIFTFILFGRLWCLMCPLGCVGEWAHRTRPPVRNQLPTRSLIFRGVFGIILGVSGALVLGITLGLFLGYDAEVIMGRDVILSQNFATAIIEYGFYAATLPLNIATAIFTHTLEAFASSDIIEIVLGIVWAGSMALGLFVGVVTGYVLPEFVKGSVVGTPLEQESDPRHPYPKRLRSLWILVGLFAGIMVFDFVVGMFVNPLFTSLFVVLLITMSIVMGLFYERRAFCQYVCPLAAIIGIYGLTGATEVRNIDLTICRKCKTKECKKGRVRTGGTDALGVEKEDFGYPSGYACPMGEFPMTMDRNLNCIMCFECFKSCPNNNISLNLRQPLVDTYNLKRRWFDQAALAAVLVGLTLAVALPSTDEGAFYYNLLLKTLGSGFEFIAIMIWFIVVAFLIPIGSFFVVLFFSKTLGGLHRESVSDLFKIFAYSIVPLGLSLHLAFWVIRIFDFLPDVLNILADPFGGYFMGHSLFTITGELILTDPVTFPVALFYLVNPIFVLGFRTVEMAPLVPHDFAFAFRVMSILLGLVGSVYSATNAMALNLPKHKDKTLQIIIPVILWMVLFTMLGLWAAHSWTA